MNNKISPKYQMRLVKNVERAIWDEYKTYKDVKFYILKWHDSDYDINGGWENFKIELKTGGEIDLSQTLHSMSGDCLLKIAIDLGLETPDFIPSIPVFKNELKSEYKMAYSTFEKAYKQIESDPNLAVGLANSSLESIIKEILKDDRFDMNVENQTLYKLSQLILKEFKLKGEDFPIEIRTISSSLIAICQGVEKLRSEKTAFHGKTNGDQLIEDSIYVTLVVNCVATVGLFLNSYYKYKHPKKISKSVDGCNDDLPF